MCVCVNLFLYFILMGACPSCLCGCGPAAARGLAWLALVLAAPSSRTTPSGADRYINTDIYNI